MRDNVLWYDDARFRRQALFGVFVSVEILVVSQRNNTSDFSIFYRIVHDQGIKHTLVTV